MARLDEIITELESREQTPELQSQISRLKEKQAVGSPAGIAGAFLPNVQEGITSPPSGRPISFPQEEGGAVTRLQTAAFRTPEFKTKFLQKKFGAERARLNEITGEPEFSPKEGFPFIPLDKPGFTMTDILDFLVEDAPEIAGQIIAEPTGAAIGAASPIPGGAFIGKAIGAGVGQALGAGIRQPIQQALLGESEPFNPLTEFATGAGTEALTTGAIGGLKKLISPAIGKKGIREARRGAERLGVRLPLVEATQNPVVGKGQNALTALSFFSRGEQLAKKAVVDYDKVIRKEAVDRFGREIDREVMGDVISAGIDSTSKTLRSVANSEYAKVYSNPAAASFSVPVTELQKTARRVQKEMANFVTGADTSTAKAFVDNILSISEMSLKQLAEKRSEISASIRGFNFIFGGRGKRWATLLNNAANKDIDTWGKSAVASGIAGKDIVDKLRSANTTYAKIMKLLKNEQVGKIFEGVASKKIAPEKIPGKFIKPDTPSAIRKLRDAIPGEWRKVRAFVANDIIMQGSEVVAGNQRQIVPSKLTKIINKYEKGGALRAVFPKVSDVKALKRWADVGTLLNAAEKKALGANPSKTASNLMRSGSLAGLVGGTAAQSPGVVVAFGAVPLIDFVLNSKPMVKFLTRDKVLSKGKEAALRLAARKAFLDIIQEVTGQNDLQEPTLPTLGLEGL